MTTKLELQQSINRLTNELVQLRASHSESLGNIEFLEGCIEKHVAFNDKQREEIAFLRAKLADRDLLARKLIKAGNPNKPTSQRRLAMLAAREAAMTTGAVTKVGGEHV